MTPPLEFFLIGSPRSQQASRIGLRAWRRRVREEAERHWENGGAPFDGNVKIAIIYFYDDAQMDVDNIPKPILDALKGLVYNDDIQITDLVCRKRAVGTRYDAETESPVLDTAINLRQQLVYILVEESEILEEDPT